MSVFDLAMKGGPIMIVLFVLSIISIYIIIERFLKLYRVKKQDDNLIKELEDSISASDTERVEQICSMMLSNPLAKIIYSTIESTKENSSGTKDFISSYVEVQVAYLEKNLGFLSTLSAISPLIGFLGTVTGMIKVFMKIQQTGGGVDITLLAGGIWEALITTVAGLIVGITSLIFYNILIDKTSSIATQMTKFAQDFLMQRKDI